MSASPSASPSSPVPSQNEIHLVSQSTDPGQTDSTQTDSTQPTTTPTTSPEPTPIPPTIQWQAIYSPQHNAYYFYNTTTGETTWVNPLQQPDSVDSGSNSNQNAEAGPSTSTSTFTSTPASPLPSVSTSIATTTEAETAETITTTTTSSVSAHYAALQAAALAQGIDPALAHLDPSLLSSIPGAGVGGSVLGAPPIFTAKFNRHTGTFSKPDARDPSHLSEYERAKRMSEFYFDVGKWEEELARGGGSIKNTSGGGVDASGSRGGGGGEGEEEEGLGKKRKRPTKKDLERFKEQKKLKKIAKTAWLRS